MVWSTVSIPLTENVFEFPLESVPSALAVELSEKVNLNPFVP